MIMILGHQAELHDGGLIKAFNLLSDHFNSEEFSSSLGGATPFKF
jgi:hypothetical protein